MLTNGASQNSSSLEQQLQRIESSAQVVQLKSTFGDDAKSATQAAVDIAAELSGELSEFVPE